MRATIYNLQKILQNLTKIFKIKHMNTLRK